MLLLVGSEKGGTGKTTIAINLAAMLAMSGKETLLVDTDRQESATIWSAVRAEEGHEPTVTCVTKTGKVGYDLLKLKEKFENVIVDAGGRDSLELRQSMAVCDRMLIPVRPSQFDIWTLDHMANLIKEIGDKVGVRPRAGVVLNAVSSNPMVREAEEIRQVLADYSDVMPTLEAHIIDRVSFRKAAREGRAVAELQGSLADPKGSLELQRVYMEVFGEKFAPAKKVAAANSAR